MSIWRVEDTETGDVTLVNATSRDEVGQFLITETDISDPERDTATETYWTRCDECRDWLDPSDGYGDICLRCALSD